MAKTRDAGTAVGQGGQ